MNKTTQPRKQRSRRANASLHIKGTYLSAPLSKELQKKYAQRSLRVRVGDKVLVTRGQFKGKDGLVDRVDVGREKVYVKGVELSKKDGGKVMYPLHASNVRLLSLYTDDKKRFKEKKQNGQTAP